MDALEVVGLLGEDHEMRGSNVFIRCHNTEAHKNGDSKPSLCVYDADKGYYCYACGDSGSHSWLFRQHKVEVPGVTDQYKKRSHHRTSSDARIEPPRKPKAYKQYPLAEIYRELSELPKNTHQALLDKGFTIGDFEQLAGWRWYTPFKIKGWKKGIFIPYFSIDQKDIVGARIRYPNGDIRFMSLPEGESFPYMWHNLDKPIVFVTEGETDCLTLMFNGIPAVGIPGSTNAEAISKMMKEAKKRNTKLIIVPDSDDAGKKFLDRIRLAAFEHFVPIDDVVIPYPYKDVNEFWTGSDKDLFINFFTQHTEDDPGPAVTLVPELEQEKLEL